MALNGKRRVNAAISLFLFAFLILLVFSFSYGAYQWAFKVNRMQSHAINPIMYPNFRLVNTSSVCCSQEPYYKLWRTYDYMADGYAPKRPKGTFTRVPVIYVHGNGGSYFCARSLARFLYESNVRMRERAADAFHMSVLKHVHAALRLNASAEAAMEEMPLSDNETSGDALVKRLVPQWMHWAAEEDTIAEEMPLLATELFSVDYLEESYTHSGVITMKEARFLNHSLHVLMRGFMDTYSAVISSSARPLRLGLNGGEDTHSKRAPYPVPLVEEEYTSSLCQDTYDSVAKARCRLARKHLRDYSSLERVRREAQRVQERGFWLWAESLGGTVAIMAALLSPHLCAGVVLIASPVHYPPLFFDVGSVWLFRAVHAASALHYPLAARDSAVNWERDVFAKRSSSDKGGGSADLNTVLARMRDLPTEELAVRIANVTLLSINGGALDDVIPSISAYLLRSTPRLPSMEKSVLFNSRHRHRRVTGVSPQCAYRRDLSTEALRGCGLPMDHRGLVYGLQFLEASANSLVLAALMKDSHAYFGPEAALPYLHSPRLFPSIVETIGATRDAALQEEFRSVSSMSLVTQEGDANAERVPRIAISHVASLIQDKKRSEDASIIPDGMLEVCVGSGSPVDLWSLRPEHGERLTDAGYYDGNDVLHVFVGSTTYAPEHVHMPRLQFFKDRERRQRFNDGEATFPRVSTWLATKLHLPVLLKGSKAIPGKTLLTLLSFQATRDEISVPIKDKVSLAWPQFCFYVNTSIAHKELEAKHHNSFLQYDRIDFETFARLHRERHLPGVGVYEGNNLHVEAHNGYSLVTGVTPATQETSLSLSINSAAAVFPVVICGSAHAFYLATRGTEGLALDEPEDQIQLFFGPFLPEQREFTFSWKVFSVYPGNFNSTYICYAVGDSYHIESMNDKAAREDVGEVRPQVDMLMLRTLAEEPVLSQRFLYWLLHEWPERWVASFSVYTAIGKLGGSYVVYTCTLLFPLYGLLQNKFFQTEQLQADYDRTLWRWLAWMRCAPALVLVLVVGAVMEMVMGLWAEHALQVCRTADIAGRTDAEMTALMGLREKATLVLLYWMKPSFKECQFPWIRIHTVPIWPLLAEHIANVWIGACIAAILLVTILIVSIFIGAAVYPLERFILRPLLRRHSHITAGLLLALWLLPSTVLSWVVPAVPMAYRMLFSALLAQGVASMLPWRIRPGLCYWWICTILVVACWFPSHFEGLVLTIRNTVMLRDHLDAFFDPERYELTLQQKIVYCIVQAALAVNYGTVYAVLRNEATLTIQDAAKRIVTKEEKVDRVDSDPEVLRSDGYILGDLGRRWPWLHRGALYVHNVTLILSMWGALVAMRHPLEGGVTLVGNMLLLVHIASFCATRW